MAGQNKNEDGRGPMALILRDLENPTTDYWLLGLATVTHFFAVSSFL
jgi:hypothetical protein